ncbi:MFS transporter [Amycolatopsis acidicola]|uniref:MFS transporter n=1 Tax=Amycolatopsis acidicola TaxID=2596893 RepID=A0A5N0VF13_9PSEU|nr:MFS transporter [Amycolatopsis acidicola]KAA9164034.1 MFS transporter [Amycolatopsis acidicola]
MRSPSDGPVSAGRWRAGLCAFFLSIGISFASWITRTPDIRDALGASTAQMGLALAGLSVGSIVGVTAAGILVARFGPWRVMTSSALLMIVGLLVIALATVQASTVLVSAGLSFFGLGVGLSEVATNVEGAYLESVSGVTVLPPLHGSYNIGSVVGGVLGIVASARHVPVLPHLGGAGLVMILVGTWAMRGIPVRPGSAGDRPRVRARPASVWRDRSLLLIGVVILGMALAEGTANDWLPLIAVDDFAASKPIASLAFTLFSVMMAVGRFSAGPLLRALGRVNAIRLTATTGALGIVVVTLAPSLAVAVVGVVLWGFGASLGFPVAISAAGDDPARATARVTVVTMVGYVAFLAGPPLLGQLGQEVSLRNAIVVTAGAVVIAGLCAPALRKTRQHV